MREIKRRKTIRLATSTSPICTPIRSQCGAQFRLPLWTALLRPLIACHCRAYSGRLAVASQVKAELATLKKNRNRKVRNRPAAGPGSGFDFGHLPRALFASTSSFDLNTHLTAARVNGCAYGYDEVEGYPTDIPCLTLVGEDEEELLKASKCLESWGCLEDGDAVDLEILLKNDGGYLLGLQPNYKKMSVRMLRDRSLVQAIFTGATWIKTLDTTNPMLLDWRDYLRSKLAPIKIMFATAKSVNRIPQMDTFQLVPEAITFVKFDVRITSQEEEPEHWFLKIVGGSAQRLKGRGPVKDTPNDVAVARKRIIDTAFPVSRARIRRAGLADQVRALANNSEITASQVEQAAINLMLSREWTGADHYVGIDDLEREWRARVGKRVEVCRDPDKLAELQLTDLIAQISLDVEYALREHGATRSPKFATNQRQFVRLGYASA